MNVFQIQAVFNKTMKIVRKLEQKVRSMSYGTDYPFILPILISCVYMIIFQASEVTPENNAFTLMFLYVGVQLFSDAHQAHEILEVIVHADIITEISFQLKTNFVLLNTSGVVPLL